MFLLLKNDSSAMMNPSSVGVWAGYLMFRNRQVVDAPRERKRLAVAKIAQLSGGRRELSIVQNPMIAVVALLDVVRYVQCMLDYYY
jgi:hypothetical protein